MTSQRLALVGLLLVFPGLLFAQELPNVAKGFTPAGVMTYGGPDSINAFNGNLILTVPLGQSYPVNGGFSYQLTAVYNSEIWERQDNSGYLQSFPLRTANAGLGWMVSLGRFNPPASVGDFDTARDTFMAPDGSRHTFYPTLHEGETPVAGVEYTRDGTYLRYKSGTQEVDFPDGRIEIFDSFGYPTQIRDPFNNQVNIAYKDLAGNLVSSPSAMLWQIWDTQGRVHKVYFKSLPGTAYQLTAVDYVEVAAFGGARATYWFKYNIGNVAPDVDTPISLLGCDNSDPTTSNIAVAFLTEIDQPDGSKYKAPVSDYVDYTSPADAYNPCRTGLITTLTLPTRGKVAWNYSLYKFPQDSTQRQHMRRNAGVGTRSTFDANGSILGTWQYATVLSAPSGGAYSDLVNTETDPMGDQIQRFFSVCVTYCSPFARAYEYGLPFSPYQAGDGAGHYLSTRVLAPGGSLKRSAYLLYEHDPAMVSGTWQDNLHLDQRMVQQRVIFDDDGGRYANDAYWNFDGYGHYGAHQSGGNFPGNNTRTEAVGYWPPSGGAWILDTYSFAWQSEGSQLLYRSFCFEPSTGFLLGRRVQNQSGSGYTAADVVEIFGRDSAGNRTSESYYGGDTQAAVPTETNAGYICQLVANPAVIGSPVYQISHSYGSGVRRRSTYTVGGSTLNILDLTADSSTGLPISTRDTAGVATTYGYDTMGRPTSVQAGQDAPASMFYRVATSASSLAQTDVSRDSGGITLSQQRTTFDALGRVALEEQQMPGGSWSGRTTYYNAAGWRSYLSEQGTTSFGTSFRDFDAFGRPTTIRPADGAGHDVKLTYTGARVVQRQSKVATSALAEPYQTTTEIYDRFGRLYEVDEPNGTVTRYTYDAGNHVSQVCQNVVSGVCGQVRSFTFDNRGFLLSETHPELGVNGKSSVTYSSYDARGHATRRSDGLNDLTFVFDKAERLTLVRESGSGFTDCTNNGGHRCIKSFTYALNNGTTGSGAFDYRKGKLISSSRYNSVGPPFSQPTIVEVKEAREYAGRSGRISAKNTNMILNGTQLQTFGQTFVWNELGDLASETYPDCTTAAQCGSSSPRTESYGYSYGRLTSVSGFASSISYDANGTISQIAHTNGVVDYQRRDPNWMPRPAEIYAYTNSGTFGLWTTGAFQYDGSGNVWKRGNDAYVYDPLSRVLSSTIYSGAYSNGTASTQSYTYDAYGNLGGVTTDGTTVSTPTTASTNHLSSGSYDAAGDLVGWNGNSYEFDRAGQLIRMVSGSEDWRYIYNADEQRFWSYKVGGTGSTWALRGLDDQVRREYSAHLSWGNYRDYVYRGAALLGSALSAAAGGGVSHYHPDHLGTPRLITDATGSPANVSFHSYYPFGQEMAATYTTAYTDRVRFTGQERDLANISGQADDLDYFHARFRSPLTGRFLSVDPVNGSPRNPQTWNRYAYVGGNPMKYTDPTGLFMWPHVFPPVGVTLCDLGWCGSVTVTAKDPGSSSSTWQFAPGPNTGVWGLRELMTGRSFLRDLGEDPLGTGGRGVAAAGRWLWSELNAPGQMVCVGSGSSQVCGEWKSATMPSGPGGLGGVKVLKAARLKALGIDPEQAKLMFLGREAAGMHNIGVDEAKNVFWVPVSRDSGSAVAAEVTLDDLINLFR